MGNYPYDVAWFVANRGLQNSCKDVLSITSVNVSTTEINKFFGHMTIAQIKNWKET
jgi:hypothetical protein